MCNIMATQNITLIHKRSIMKKYLYLSLAPEALISSMLSPEEFGNYLAVGTKKRTRGQAMFFEVDPDFQSSHFPLKDSCINEKCIPHADGTPKRSVYISIYRVLEQVPIDKLKQLYLVTDDGRVLGLESGEFTIKNADGHLHLYQQIIPVNPRIASTLNPMEFMKFVTDTRKAVSVPKLVFVELRLNELAIDPGSALVNDLPYPNIDHLKDCLVQLKTDNTKKTKTIIRNFNGALLYRTCKNGFFVGDQTTLRYYPLPTLDELEEKHYTWWRSALVIGF
jgi:hypothetical protein